MTWRSQKNRSVVNVVQFQRRPSAEQFSIEGYFERVRSHAPSGVSIRCHIVPFASRGVFRRLVNCISCWWNRSEVNHVTGDIHFVTLLLPRRRTVLTIHDCQILERLVGWRRQLVRWLWYTLPVRRVCQITVNSEETKRQLLKVVSFPADRIHVIPVSVSELLRPSPRGFDESCPRVLQIGTKANKNVPRLIEALTGIPCELDLIGPVSDDLRNQLNASGIRWQNRQRLSPLELYEAYKVADIVSFVSTYEGFGMPIVEAQRVERVCVTSSCSSLPEVAGAGACLVDPFDVQSIADGFRRVIRDASYRESLIAAGRKNCQRFMPEQISEDFARVYREVVRELES